MNILSLVLLSTVVDIFLYNNIYAKSNILHIRNFVYVNENVLIILDK